MKRKTSSRFCFNRWAVLLAVGSEMRFFLGAPLMRLPLGKGRFRLAAFLTN
jgi:hypothetical protein